METTEEFKPVSVTHDASRSGRLLFGVRCLVDLQLKTIYDFLKSALPPLRGQILDVGCGESPYAHLLSAGTTYTGVDIVGADQFGMSARSGVVAFDGKTLPFPEGQFDHVLCTEVIEHVKDPVAFVAELWRVLKGGGTLVATVPFSARVHHEPFDYQRFTQYGLQRLLARFTVVRISPRGTDLASIVAKLVVVYVRLARPRLEVSLVLRMPLLVVAAPGLIMAIALAQVALAFDFGSRADPLGYSIICVK